MANQNRDSLGPLVLRVESGAILAPETVAGKVENWVVTDDGTLRTIAGPTPYVPALAGYLPPAKRYTYSTLGALHGVFHAVLPNGRDLLLIHAGTDIAQYEGWTRTWHPFIGVGADLIDDSGILDDSAARAPTQFELTPGGVVIIPQGRGRAYIYDGVVCIPLGYDRAPGAPSGSGPRPDNDALAVSAVDYDVSGNTMHFAFGNGRIGTLRAEVAETDALSIIEEGSYRAAVQWVDHFGNLSPIGGRSATVRIPLQRALDGATEGGAEFLKQLAWDGIEPGPEGTVGRLFLRTKDELHSGTLDLHIVPPNAVDGTHAFATIPDNVSTAYPDNAGDSWLIVKALDVAPVPKMTLAKMAFGRLFAAERSRIAWSMPGRYGTFLEGDELAPDPTGADITGMWPVAGGLLVMTDSSVYLIEPNDSGDGFRSSTLDTAKGCVAPNSIKTMQDGSTIWLGREGFYRLQGREIELISGPVRRQLRYLNQSRRVMSCAVVDPKSGEYRCFVPMDGSLVNNVCWVYNGFGWKRRTEIASAVDACVSRDWRQLVLVAGRATDSDDATTNNVWVADHEAVSWEPQDRESVLETSWIGANQSSERRSSWRARFWIRESGNGTFTVETLRDWRDTVIDTFTGNLHTDEDEPSFWGTTELGETDAVWLERRPFWTKVDVFLPSCEVFKIRIKTSNSMEIVAVQMDQTHLPSGGARTAE
jgi:hypothetical protein